ncbi:hypothetical protein CDCA_CDCA18G4480 [Cyanidium caldarium]|uniref:UBC core domain-containing protein n=1 Tax=Cyanidium caldarium TaxID=2771 RepID=A0AAV9J2B2_CYACA|nr:hypothetical protein CDCA_CDCA18G4480 [Cyanidium caldarium]
MQTKRLLHERKELAQEAAKGAAASGFILEPEGDSMSRFRGYLCGPPDTPFAGGRFRVLVTLPPAYPMSPPEVRFRTPVFHPNVHFRTGEVCLDVLKAAWSPAWSLASCMRALLVLLACPEPSSPLNCDAGNLLRCGDERGYRSMARMYVRRYALPDAKDETTEADR